MESKMYVELVGYLPVKGDDVFLVCPSALVPFPALRERASRSTATLSIWTQGTACASTHRCFQPAGSKRADSIIFRLPRDLLLFRFDPSARNELTYSTHVTIRAPQFSSTKATSIKTYPRIVLVFQQGPNSSAHIML